jgi:hypothetical protein
MRNRWIWGIGDNVNLGNVKESGQARPDLARQVSAMGFAVVIGVLGLVGVHPTEGRAEAASAALASVDRAAPVLDLPMPPALVWSPETASTTTTVPVETTTTTAPPPPPEPPTTTTTAPSPPPTTAPPKPKAASSGPEAQAQIEAIADSTGWDWRAAGVRFKAAYHPTECCHWGVYERDTSIIWVGPSAFGDQHRLRYVVLHELAHAWQYRQNRFREIIADYTRWGFSTIGPALEAGADCVADVWGALRGHYWNCPADAQALAVRRLNGDWR